MNRWKLLKDAFFIYGCIWNCWFIYTLVWFFSPQNPPYGGLFFVQVSVAIGLLWLGHSFAVFRLTGEKYRD